MKKLVFIAIVTVLVWNCKGKEKKSGSQNGIEVTETGDDSPKLEKGCYEYDENNSTVLFEIENTTGLVSGRLMYRLDGKDRNIGTFEGTLNGDRLIGTYTFMSEGAESSREVAYQVKEGQLVEGYGELNEDGTSFKDYSSIEFSSKMPLTRMECDPWRSLCPFEEGKSYSELERTCLESATLNIKPEPLNDGAMIKGAPAYLLFNGDRTKAELFPPVTSYNIVLERSAEGNWAYKDYVLIAWKGYVTQKKGVPIFVGQ